MLIILDVVLFAFFVFLYHWKSTTDFGSEIGRKLLPQNVLVALFITLVIVLDKPLSVPIFAAATFGLWATWLLHRLRNPPKNQVLLSWKRARSAMDIILMIAAVLLGSIVIVFGLTRELDQLYYVFMGILIISLLPVVYFQKEVCITEDGIETGRDYIRWEQIESYRWSKYDKSFTHVFFQTSRRLPIVNFV